MTERDIALAHKLLTHIRDLINDEGYLYENEEGDTFKAFRPDELNQRLRWKGWKNNSRTDEDDYKKMGLRVEYARYIGGARAKKFCYVVALPKRAHLDSLERTIDRLLPTSH